MQNINRERRIKKHVLAGKHSVELIAQPGFQDATFAEFKKYIGEKRTDVDKTHIAVEDVSFDEVLKLVYLLKTVDDIWLKLAQFRFKGLLPLAAQLDLSLVPISFDFSTTQIEFKVEIIKSHFQEKKDLVKSLTEYFRAKAELEKEETADAKKTKKTVVVQVRLFRDVFSLFVPLANDPLYKRGFRTTTQVDAPLKETIASCAIQTFLNAHPLAPTIDTLFVPFGGSGTFLFEYWLYKLDLPNHTNHQLQLENLAFYPKAKCDHLKKKSLESKTDVVLTSVYCDSSEKAALAFQKNLTLFEKSFIAAAPLTKQTSALGDDFFNLNFSAFKKSKHIFMPLNPPYGLRLQKQSVEKFYADIGKQIVKIKNDHPMAVISGVVFCASEATWKQLLSALKPFKTSTQHFMQGGLDIRMVQFTSFLT